MRFGGLALLSAAIATASCNGQPDCSLDAVLNDTVDPSAIDCGDVYANFPPNPPYDAVRTCIANALAQGQSFKAHLMWDGIDWFLIKNESRMVELTWESSDDSSNGDVYTVWTRQECSALMDAGVCPMPARDAGGALEYGFFCYACAASVPVEHCSENEGGGTH